MALGLSKALLVATLMPARIFPEMENRPIALRPCRTEKISSLYSSGFPHEGFSHSVSTANFTATCAALEVETGWCSTFFFLLWVWRQMSACQGDRAVHIRQTDKDCIACNDTCGHGSPAVRMPVCSRHDLSLLNHALSGVWFGHGGSSRFLRPALSWLPQCGRGAAVPAQDLHR